LRHLFPTPEVLAAAEGDALGQLGIVRQRQAAIVAIARAVAQGRLAAARRRRRSRHGGGAEGIAGHRRLDGAVHRDAALRWPDAFPAGDVALHKALGVQQSKQPAREAEAASQAWKPVAQLRGDPRLEREMTPTPEAPAARPPRGGASGGPAKPVPRWHWNDRIGDPR
jgi:AraC family transcriptional regulator of adaptative response / DNA-3-methyladenine glycosylase II